METIELKQLPVIQHKLSIVGENVRKRISDLNIDKLIATEDSVKSLKDLRSDLNKELKEFEEQRKAVKQKIADPYIEFEAVYKIEISDSYTKAIDMLKDKIAIVETRVKEEKQAAVKLYFDELVVAENIDFLIFANVGLDINLSTTEKAYKEKCNEFVYRVKDDVTLIKTQEFEAEIMAEYKTCLNASKSISSVLERKQRERTEAERIKQQEWSKRVGDFRNLAMIIDITTNAFVFNDELYISVDKVRAMNNLEFGICVTEFEQKIKDFNKQKAKESAAISQKINGTPVEPVKQVAEPLQAPIIEANPDAEILEASFTITGTLAQLKSVGEFMRTNNINYKNI